MTAILQRIFDPVRGRSIPTIPELFGSSGGDVRPVVFTRTAFEDVLASVGHLPAETGALLGGDPEKGVICMVRFDANAKRTSAQYSPDHEWVNRLLKEEWNPAGVRLFGFVHSHPRGAVSPSTGDAHYAERILAAIPDLERLVMPIVQTAPDTGQASMRVFVAERGTQGVLVRETPIYVTPNDDQRPLSWFDSPAFARVADAVNLPLLARCRLVVVGVGGGAQFVETMVRQGVGEVALIDPDVVDLPNLATQQVYRRDLGRAKVDALRDRLRDVNPSVSVRTIPASLDTQTDSFLSRLATRRWPGRPQPEVTLWCGFTDDFWAQARVNRLALNLGQPMLAAQVWPRGAGVEVSFMAPGITPACGRCVLGQRYRAWLQHGFSTPGRSQGTPLPVTDRLNALKGHLALALLHGMAGSTWSADPASKRWRRLLDAVATRNLAVVRLDPDIATSLGVHLFDQALGSADRSQLAMDETIWRPQEPESPATGFPPCGDCGGTGDLRAVVGTIRETRLDAAAPACEGRHP